jgi:hypothetical protein
MTTLTPTQLDILTYAVNRTEGRLEWFPPQIRGGAQAKVLKALHDRQLITWVDPVWYVDAQGYAALGLPRPGAKTVFKPASEPAETLVDPVEAEPAAEPEAAPRSAPRTRDHSKQATVIALLRRPEGATLAQITEATAWQVHSTRGFLAGAVKKRLGLNLTSDKPQGGVRVYRIIEEVAS